MLVRTLFLIPIATVAFAGCTSGGIDVDAANQAAPPGEEYAATGPLLRDLNQGGVSCAPGGEEKQPGALGTTLSKTQMCTSREGGYSVTAVVYPGRMGPELAAEGAALMAKSLGEYGASALVLSGPNWYVTSTEDDSLLEAQKVIGGSLLKG